MAEIQESDMMSIMLNQFKELNKRFDTNDTKFDELKNEMQEFKSSINKKLDIQNEKFDELKSEIQEINKHLESTNQTIRTSLNKLEQSVEKLGDNVLSITNINNDERMKDVVSNSENDNVNYNSESIVGVKNNGETNDENIIENSTYEVSECDNEMLMCINELESCLLYTSRCV